MKMVTTTEELVRSGVGGVTGFAGGNPGINLKRKGVPEKRERERRARACAGFMTKGKVAEVLEGENQKKVEFSG